MDLISRTLFLFERSGVFCFLVGISTSIQLSRIPHRSSIGILVFHGITMLGFGE
jgi:hypothetical protein